MEMRGFFNWFQNTNQYRVDILGPLYQILLPKRLNLHSWTKKMGQANFKTFIAGNNGFFAHFLELNPTSFNRLDIVILEREFPAAVLNSLLWST